ncbi:MAG: hypothetical protein IPK13_10955 [Deltaproteobacteria bacterium]|nr:hypothetical protein [Deltaproteobacteria bacterium]
MTKVRLLAARCTIAGLSTFVFQHTAHAQGPHSGFMMEARLSTLNMPGFVDPSNGVGGPPALMLGYRTPRFSLAFGPALHRVAVRETPCENTGDGGTCTDASDIDALPGHVTLVGGHAAASFILAAMDNDHLELYTILGASAARVIRAGKIRDTFAYGLLAGVGLRYFLAGSFALGAEIGEGFGVVPLASGVAERRALGTWGAITLAVVFGEA